MGDKSSKSSSGVTRRQFLAGTVGAACAAGLAGLGLASYTRQARGTRRPYRTGQELTACDTA